MSGIHNPPDWERDMASRLSYELHEANFKLKQLTELAKDVELMRKHQKYFFRTRSNEAKMESINMEKRVDEHIKEIIHPEDKSQTKLF